ncbi:hypothetical protein J5N97_017368 [Dioscorea zingiberensis]|uniref:Late embryogenesis abundant protein LEA-2 subgroup domain-containing protein n=1 Tax=Dioscorea zingiberensis TaxID=325984 RepID=A0A9D5CL36_9LILI|nr:hypothetical protein J5N97_017368 [Dioscorea zingiberensis]
MEERVHPHPHPDLAEEEPSTDPLLPPKAQPKPGTYVIQIPKDQIYRIPPPQNNALFEFYSRRSSGARRHRSCRRFLLFFLLAILLLSLIIFATLSVLYLTLRPRLPSYDLSHLSLTSAPNSSSPSFLAAFRVHNPNKKFSLHYLSGGSLSLSYSDSALAAGDWPAFRQSPRNLTSFNVTISGSGVRLPREVVGARRTVAFAVDVKAPVKFKIGRVRSWGFTVKTGCDVTVSKLTAGSKIVSQACRVRLRL